MLLVNTKSPSRHREPAQRRSCSWRLRCSRSAVTTRGARAIARLLRTVFGSTKLNLAAESLHFVTVRRDLSLREMCSMIRAFSRLADRFDYDRLHADDLEARRLLAANERERRRQQWHLARRGFRPCLLVPACQYWFRGRSDGKYCSHACRQAAYRERHAVKAPELAELAAKTTRM